MSVFIFTHYIQAYSAFNIQKTQYELDMNVFTSYVASINKINTTIKNINIVGNPPFARIANNTSESFPVTNTKYDIFFHRYTKLWNMRSLFSRFGLDISYIKNKIVTDEELSDCTNVVEFNKLYNVLVKGQTVIFDFNKSCPPQARSILSNMELQEKKELSGVIRDGLVLESVANQKVSLVQNIIFEFNKSLYSESKSGEKKMCITFHEKGSKKAIINEVDISQQVKIGSNYYLLSNADNLSLDQIESISIGFCGLSSDKNIIEYEAKINTDNN